MSHPINRRLFLLGAAAVLCPKPKLEAASPGPLAALRERSLSFYNLHTSEKLKAVYWNEGEYLSESLEAINRHLRDYRTGAVHPIDPKLLDSLCELRLHLGTSANFELISGYRSPATNSQLRGAGHGVAERSLHMDGKAADIRLPGTNLAHIRKAAIAMKAGGVGYYPASQFVHIDVGRIRTW